MQYSTLKTSAYKNKYETALETLDERISYGELLQRVNALYNSLCQMDLCKKTIAVFTGNSVNTVYTVYAALRAGCNCVIMSPAGNAQRINRSLSKYRPAAAFVNAHNLGRLAPSLKAFGCNCAVATSECDERLLPIVYEIEELLEFNDYSTHATGEVGGGQLIFESACAPFEFFNDILNTKTRSGILLCLPLYTGAAFAALDTILTNGKKCVFLNSPTSQLVKKKNISLAICADFDLQLGCNTVFYKNANTFGINGQILYCEDTENYISAACGYPVSCDIEGSKLKILVTLGANTDMSVLKNSPLTSAISECLNDALYGINCPKSIVFKKTV